MENANQNDIYYEIYIKDQPASEIIQRVNLFDIYDTSKKYTSSRTITYYDTPDNRLDLAKIILSTDIEDGKGEIVLEKNIEYCLAYTYYFSHYEWLFDTKLANRCLIKNVNTNFQHKRCTKRQL